MSDFTMTIDGKSVVADTTFGVIKPAIGKIFAQAPACSRGESPAAPDPTTQISPAT